MLTRLRRYRDQDMFGEFPKNLRACMAPSHSPQESEARRLVYVRYLAANYITERASGEFTRPQHADTVVIVEDFGRGAVVGTVSFYGDSPLGLPLERAFGREIAAMRDADGMLRFVEISELAVRPGPQSLRVLSELSRILFAWPYVAKVDAAVVAVGRSLAPFFRLVTDCEELGSERSYSPEDADPVVGLIVWDSLDGARLRAHLRALDATLGAEVLYPFYFESDYWERISEWLQTARS